MFGVQILENAMKRKEDNYIGKSTRDGPTEEKVHKEIGNMEDLMKRKGRSDANHTIALNRTSSTIDNGNRGMG